MRIPNLLPVAVLCLASVAAHADTFTISTSGSGGGFSGSGTFDTTSNGNGSLTITGISGPGVTGLLGLGVFGGNDNLLFPTSSSLLDSSGFAFRDLQGDVAYSVRIYDSNGAYFANLLDNEGLNQTVPVDFTLSSVTPEPSSLLLLATGLLGAGVVMRRRLPAM